jgi:hypothetical protein
VRLTGPGRIWLQTQSYGRQAAPSGAVAGNVRGSGRPSLEIVR